MLFTILQTCLLNRIDPKLMLLAYFQACAENGGCEPQNLAAFLPWNLPEEKRSAWQLGQGFP